MAEKKCNFVVGDLYAHSFRLRANRWPGSEPPPSCARWFRGLSRHPNRSRLKHEPWDNDPVSLSIMKRHLFPILLLALLAADASSQQAAPAPTTAPGSSTSPQSNGSKNPAQGPADKTIADKAAEKAHDYSQESF